MPAETSVAARDVRGAGDQRFVRGIVEHDHIYFDGLCAGVRVRRIMPADAIPFDGCAVGLRDVLKSNRCQRS